MVELAGVNQETWDKVFQRDQDVKDAVTGFVKKLSKIKEVQKVLALDEKIFQRLFVILSRDFDYESGYKYRNTWQPVLHFKLPDPITQKAFDSLISQPINRGKSVSILWERPQKTAQT